MKRNLLSFVLALCLLLTCSPMAYAAAGSANDPLISKSYAENWASGLLTELTQQAAERIQRFWTELQGNQNASSSQSLPADSTVILRSGASITLVSGTAKVTITKGSFINVSVGGAAISGRVIPGHKYIVCENSEATVTITQAARLIVEGDYTVNAAAGTDPTPTPIPPVTPTPTPSPTATPSPTPLLTPTPTLTPSPSPAPTAAPTPTPVVIVIEPTPIIIYVPVTPTPTPTPTPVLTPEAPVTPTPNTTANPVSPTPSITVTFKDVASSAWFYDDLKCVIRLGIMSGTSGTKFSPGDALTKAEAIALTAKIHQLYNEDEITLKKGFWLWWYRPYRKYAVEHDLIDESYDSMSRKKLNTPVTKGELAEMLYNTLPEEALEAINEIPDNSIPDVKNFSTRAKEIYTLYRAGILTGYLNTEGVQDYSFKAHESINRAETAVIAARMMEPDRRVEFTIEK